MKKFIYILIGSLFIILAIIGWILPIMPGTIFFLIGIYMFCMASDKFYNFFINTKLYKKYLEKYFGKFLNERINKNNKNR